MSGKSLALKLALQFLHSRLRLDLEVNKGQVLLSLQTLLADQEPKNPPKPKKRTNSTKEFSEQFEGFTGSLHSKTRLLRQIAPESSPERSVNLCHTVSLWYLFCPQAEVFRRGNVLRGSPANEILRLAASALRSTS